MNLDPESRDLIIRTVIGEADGEPDIGKLGVVQVIRNRMNAGGYGSSGRDVVLAPKQFSPWNDRGNELMSIAPTDPRYTRVGNMVDAVFGGNVPDFTKGSTHFANIRASDPVNQSGWINEMIRNGSALQIGRHTFGRPDSAPGRRMAAATGDDSGGITLQLPDEGGPSTVSAPAQGGGASRGAAALTFREVPDTPAKLTFREIPEAPAAATTDLDPRGRINQAFEAPVMAGTERADPEGLRQRMQIVQQQRELGTGPGGAAVRGAVAGPFLGWLGEAAGGLNAADQYLQNIGTGKASEAAGRAYTSTVEAERIARQLDEANNPVARATAEIGGSLAAPIGPLGRVVTAGRGVVPAIGRAGEVGLKGAAIGAISGAGNADGGLEERLSGAQGGAVLGGAVGAASRPVAGVVGAALRPVAGVVNAARGAVRPTAEAERRVEAAIARDAANRDLGLSGQQLDDALAAGKPVVAADVGGETTRALARSAANTSPEGRAALEEAAGQRFITQAGRLSETVGEQSGYRGGASGVEFRDAIAKAQSAASKPAYQRAYLEGDRGIWNPELERLASSPAVVAAMKAAATRGKDRAVLEGFGGFNPGVTVTDDGLVKFATGKSGVPTYPNLQYWDYVKRELSDGASQAFRAGRTEEGSVLSNLAQRMRNSLDKEVPAYQYARKTYAVFEGADNAFEAGQKFVSQSLKGDALGQARKSLGQMTNAEKTLFREGFIADLKSKLASIPENQDVTKRIFNSKASRDQIELALGKGGASKLEADIHVEKIMDRLRGAVKGNSTTARQQLEAAMAGGIGNSIYAGDLSWSNFGSGALAGSALRAGAARIDTRVSRKVADILASDDPDRIRRLAQVAAQSPQYMSALRNLSARFAGSGGGQNAEVGARAFGGPAGAAAEEDQPR